MMQTVYTVFYTNQTSRPKRMWLT